MLPTCDVGGVHLESAGGERCSRLPLYNAVSIVPMKAKDHDIHMTNRGLVPCAGEGKKRGRTGGL